MRRPLKPFVTEYKGTRRSPQNQPQGFGPAQAGDTFGAGSDPQGQTPRTPKPSGLDGDWSRAKPFDAAPKPDSDDAYEAAMRAADALFTRPDVPRAEPLPAALSSATPSEETAAATPPERGGRILRAIDEAPPPQFAALEAAYAPKRRGRKPGSKNKPKIAALPASEPVAAITPSEAVGAPAPAAASANAASSFLASTAPELEKLEALTVPNGTLRAERRAPWARDRLKPGEGWKRRRLPRVCW